MTKICVYGSLLSDLGNHGVLRDSKLIKKETIQAPYFMVSLGGFPGLIPDRQKTNHKIVVEIYSVTNDIYKSVERLEGFPHFYQKATVSTTEGQLEIYVLEKERLTQNVAIDLIDGAFNWKGHLEKRNDR